MYVTKVNILFGTINVYTMAFNRGRIMYVTPISKGSKKKKKIKGFI